MGAGRLLTDGGIRVVAGVRDLKDGVRLQSDFGELPALEARNLTSRSLSGEDHHDVVVMDDLGMVFEGCRIDAGVESMLSLPAHSSPDSVPWVYGWTHTYGWAYGSAHDADPGQNPAWDHNKVELSFGDATAAVQTVQLSDFPTHFDENDLYNNLYGGADLDKQSGDQTVGFQAGDTEGASPRTYVGVDTTVGSPSKVFILTSSAGLTGSQASWLLLEAGVGRSDTGGYDIVQLDGGGSTQLAADLTGAGVDVQLITSNDPFFERKVPDTLAVYLAPQ